MINLVVGPLIIHSEHQVKEFLKDIKIFTVLELGVLLAQDPSKHLPCFHARPYYISVFVPVRRGTLVNALKGEELIF